MAQQYASSIWGEVMTNEQILREAAQQAFGAINKCYREGYTAAEIEINFAYKELKAALSVQPTDDAPQPAQRDSRDAWLTIETAPKDGAEIILTNGKSVCQGYWMEHEGGITELRDTDGRYIGQNEDEGYIGWWDYEGGMEPGPTHWTPMPPPPAVAATQEAK